MGATKGAATSKPSTQSKFSQPRPVEASLLLSSGAGRGNRSIGRQRHTPRRFCFGGSSDMPPPALRKVVLEDRYDTVQAYCNSYIDAMHEEVQRSLHHAQSVFIAPRPICVYCPIC
jgi:hypothetical protein